MFYFLFPDLNRIQIKLNEKKWNESVGERTAVGDINQCFQEDYFQVGQKQLTVGGFNPSPQLSPRR